MNYDQMTDDEFDEILCEILRDRFSKDPSAILGIEGIYEILKEEFNNEVLDLWSERQPEAEIDEEDYRE